MRIRSFFIDCTPPYHTPSRVNHNDEQVWQAICWAKQKRKGNKATFKKLCCFRIPPQPYETPLRVQIMFRFPMRKNEKKALRDREAIPCDKRPDCDNLAKGLLDAMQGDFFLDDAQIYDLKITKLYAQRTGIGVTIKAIDQTSLGHFPLY